MSKTILAIIRGMMAETWDNDMGSYTVGIGRRHDGWSMHLSAHDAKELREILDEVISAGDEHIRKQREASESGGTAG